MKKIVNKTTYFLLASLLFIALSGCEEQLEPKVFYELTGENFFQTPEDFNAALVSLYNAFSAEWGDTDPGDGIWYNAFFNANHKSYLLRSMTTTDELKNEYATNITNFTWGASTFTGDAGSTYVKIRHVARATDIIDKIEKSDLAPVVKARYIAEAKTLRAWLMYILYDFFGPVNCKLDPETLSDNEIIPRWSDEVYTSTIEQDLLDAIAIEEFPDSYNSNGKNWGRVSKGVARMVLLKLYMHKKQWADAEAIGKELLRMDYSLLDSYQDIFIDERNSEIIYAVPCSEASQNWWPQHMFPGGFNTAYCGDRVVQRGSGWYEHSMPWGFFDLYENGDLRLNTIISEYYTNKGDTVNRENGLIGAMPVKYTGIEGNGPGYPDDWVVFRIAEVYLSVAEAINEQHGPSDAYEYINAIRFRAGVANVEDLTQDQFRDAILDERGRELYGEGVRRQDLVRHGKFIEKALERGASAKPHQVLFPIPNAVIIEGKGIITQNDGY